MITQDMPVLSGEVIFPDFAFASTTASMNTGVFALIANTGHRDELSRQHVVRSTASL